MERRLDPTRLGDHLDRLYRAAWAYVGSREDAEDLVQETYARVLARPRWLRKEDDLGYLLRALRNTFFNQKGRAPTPASRAARPRRLIGGAGDDVLAGGAGDDVLIGGPGSTASTAARGTTSSSRT